MMSACARHLPDVAHHVAHAEHAFALGMRCIHAISKHPATASHINHSAPRPPTVHTIGRGEVGVGLLRGRIVGGGGGISPRVNGIVAGSACGVLPLPYVR
jgi:hypothetical protein